MPDGTAVLLLPRDESLVLATQAARLPDGTLPSPSGLEVTGDGAEILSAMVVLYEEHEAEEILKTHEHP